MENARLLGELQARTRDLEKSLEYQTATSDVLNVISRSTADVQPVLDTVTETAARLCGADTGAMLMREGEVYRYVSLSTRAAEPGFWAIQRQRTFVPDRDSITGRVALEGKVVHVADILADPDYAVPECGGRPAYPTWSAAAARGRRDRHDQSRAEAGRAVHRAADRTRPYLCRPGGDRDRERPAARRVAGPHGDLEESLEYQTATSDVLKVISRSTSDVQPVLDTVAETAARLCAADSATISLREGEVYRCVSTSPPMEPEYWAILRQRTIVPGRDSVAARVALEGRVVHVVDIRADPDYALPEAVGVRATHQLGVPLLRDGPSSALWSLRGNGSSRLPSGRSNWCAPLPTRRSSRSRMRGCSANCSSAPTNWPRATANSASASNISPPRSTCSRRCRPRRAIRSRCST